MNLNENLEGEMKFESRIDLTALNQSMYRIKSSLQSVIVGQDEVLDLLLTGLLANGHMLLEGVPGVAKTLIAKLLAQSLHLDYGRVQFTPDLMPSDVLGVSIYNSQKQKFEFNKGPVFANLLLIDEINRAPAKTQAALFEVMEERQVTMDGEKYEMDLPFIVIATQNPIEQEGTYRLPEAQLDRFLFLVKIHYPGLDHEFEILKREHESKNANKLDKINPILSSEELIAYQELVTNVVISDDLLKYISQIVHNTRVHSHIYLGASPRASISILKSSKAYAAIQGRDFVMPEDIQKVMIPVLQHRIIINPEKEMEGITTVQILQQILQKIEIPR